jgi:hypothetical protein
LAINDQCCKNSRVFELNARYIGDETIWAYVGYYTEDRQRYKIDGDSIV